MDYMRNQCPARGPGLSHTLHGVDGDPCRECGTPLTVTPPSPRLPQTASEARRTLSRKQQHALREAGVTPMDMPQQDYRDDTPVEPRAITGEGPQGRLWEVGRGEFTWRDELRVLAHVRFRDYLAQNGGGEEQ